MDKQGKKEATASMQALSLDDAKVLSPPKKKGATSYTVVTKMNADRTSNSETRVLLCLGNVNRAGCASQLPCGRWGTRTSGHRTSGKSRDRTGRSCF